MRLTTKSRYGTRMILDLALNSKDGHIPLSEISKRQNMSLKYLEKLIRKLRDAGIVSSRRGPSGGHQLALSPEKITVGDIVRTLEEGSAITDCSEKSEERCSICNQTGKCLSQWIWIEASNAMFKRLDQITIAMLIENRQTFIQDARRYIKEH
jgi:Rrf2 family transcriptional regulator, iron-sulfur cluster assembly transcription factor